LSGFFGDLSCDISTLFSLLTGFFGDLSCDWITFICFDINKQQKYHMVLFDILFHFSFAISSFRAQKEYFFIVFLFFVSLNLLYRSMKLYICYEIFSSPIQQCSLYSWKTFHFTGAQVPSILMVPLSYVQMVYEMANESWYCRWRLGSTPLRRKKTTKMRRLG
jgi:hypothetical protein